MRENTKTMTTQEAIMEIIQDLKIINEVLGDIDKELFIHRCEIASIKDRLNALESEKEKCDDNKTM